MVSRTARSAQRGELLSTDRAARRTPTLTADDMAQATDTFISVLSGVYAHLPLKRARYGIDPVQRLRLLRDRSHELGENDFHAEISQILTGLRDAHTRYQGASSVAGKVAVLPFLVESFGSDDEPHYVVSKIGPPALIGDAAFVPGVELLAWSGITFDRAVTRWADFETGGRPDARRSRALESLTFRSLEFGPPPDEDWVIVTYRPKRGGPREVRIPWRVVEPLEAVTAVGLAQGGRRTTRTKAAAANALLVAASRAQNPAAEAVRRAKQLLFAPAAWEQTTTATRASTGPSSRAAGRAAATTKGDREIPSDMPDVLAAKIRRTRSGEVGHLRIWSFSVDDDEAFVGEIIRLVEQMPERGLIIDLRGNPGGLIWAAERALQLFTPNHITPTRFSWLATDLTRAMALNPANMFDLSAWADSLHEAVSTGELYSQPRPITDIEACNDIGQRYGGPVMCVVDANTYSSGDLFTAGFADNGVGPVITIGQATGAGGANVWDDDLLRRALTQTEFELPELPAGIHFTLAVRRATRTGDAEGKPIEDLGVSGSASYVMTEDDLVHSNRDLISWCAARLSEQPHSSLQVSLAGRDLTIRSKELDIVDIFGDGHPLGTVAPKRATTTVTLDADPSVIEVVGWAGGIVAQRRRLAT